MDLVFKAMADPTRRAILDSLFESDGQTLTSLEQELPMTRFGVMKHLKVLEEANLVVTRRRGREKLHYLNPVPIRLVYERWVSKYSEPVGVDAHGPQTQPSRRKIRWLKSSTFRYQVPLAPGPGRRRRHRGVRDLHQDDARAPLGGDHRPGAARPLHVRRPHRVRLERPARRTSARPATS